MTGHNTSSTSILVVYGDVPAFDQNGIITNYTITYQSLTEGNNGSAIAGPNDRQKELTNLREYVDYEITVLASTSKGDGPQSSPILVSTDEDSKYCSFPNLLSVINVSPYVRWNPEYWALESRIQLLESRISLKNESRIHSLKIHFKSHKWLSRARIHATTVMLKCRLADRADHANRANHADRTLFAGEFRVFVLARKISSCGVQNLETVHTLPKEEKGVHT